MSIYKIAFYGFPGKGLQVKSDQAGLSKRRRSAGLRLVGMQKEDKK